MKALWCLWLLLLLVALTQHTSAAKQHNKQQQQRPRHQQQPGADVEPLSAFLGLLSATAAPAIATYQTVHAWNHSLPLPQLQNGMCRVQLSAAASKLVYGVCCPLGRLLSAVCPADGL